LAGGDLRLVGGKLLLEVEDRRVEAGRQVAADPPLELAALPAVGRLQPLCPILACPGPARTGSPPCVEDVRRPLEGRGGPAERVAGASDLRGAERRAMGGSLAGLGRSAERDRGFAGDHGRTVALLRRLDGAGDLVRIVPVDMARVPAG